VSAPTRPVLRYHGGKWRLAPWIITHFPAHRCYVEPFGGAASVLMRKSRAYAEVYNDLDGELVALFRVLRDTDRATALVRAVSLTPFARQEFVQSYEPSEDPVEQARRTVVRAFMGFGSNAHVRATGFRANSNRSGTTPARDWANYPDALVAIIERFRGVVVEQRDWSLILPQHDSPHTLHYVDPPYPKGTRDAGADYSSEMGDDDHRRLAVALHGLTGHVVLSGYACDLYDRELYADWRRATKDTHADGARDRTEVLWLNPACAAALDAAHSQLNLSPGAA
jgi:DNA adenine methylase